MSYDISAVAIVPKIDQLFSELIEGTPTEHVPRLCELIGAYYYFRPVDAVERRLQLYLYQASITNKHTAEHEKLVNDFDRDLRKYTKMSSSDKDFQQDVRQRFDYLQEVYGTQ